MVNGLVKNDMKAPVEPVESGAEVKKVAVAGNKNRHIVVKMGRNGELLQRNVMVNGLQKNDMSLPETTQLVVAVGDNRNQQLPRFREIQFLQVGLKEKTAGIREAVV